ncbi:hypothetical protein [Polyangium sp. 15x6]|uniref:hypothetical protein n=1 Tax=Polyangium sp. 15x6 TaxID=3042687 RepID=UPI00249CC219|nr:hypothetical protein [Polyangium sp. 15x6]MDI3282541.1 hypothetical protein [Polyangium sp. 15x6]
MLSSSLHRICHESWELIQVFRGPTIPREGELLLLEQGGQETKFRVTRVMYKAAPGGELLATVFVTPA